MSRRHVLLGGAAAAVAACVPAVTSAPKANPELRPPKSKGIPQMSTIKSKDDTTLFYKDWGEGQPIVFSHGWPLSSDAWDEQLYHLASRGYRAIAHDRRGHG